MQMDRFIAPSGDGGTGSPKKKCLKNNKLRLDLEATPALARGRQKPVFPNGTSGGLAHYRP
jgi:hypothetical protein